VRADARRRGALHPWRDVSRTRRPQHGDAPVDAPTSSPRVVRRRCRARGGRRAAARRRAPSWRAQKASATARLRTTMGGQAQGHRHEPDRPAPPPGHVDRGGVLDPGVGPFGGTAPGKGAAPGPRGVVVALGGLLVDRRRHGDRALGVHGAGSSGGVVTSGRVRSSIIEASRNEQRTLPMRAGEATRW
jgi:hypothetical protein